MSNNDRNDALERLSRTLYARDVVEDLYAVAFGPTARMTHRLSESLPLSAIPVVLSWTLCVVLPVQQNRDQSIYLYLAGLLAILLGCMSIVGLVALNGRRALPDEVLGQMAKQVGGLAYHPNAQLKTRISAKGSVSRAEFYGWVQEQRSILSVRIKDLKDSVNTPANNGTPAVPPSGPGARAFLDA